MSHNLRTVPSSPPLTTFFLSGDNAIQGWWISGHADVDDDKLADNKEQNDLLT